MVQKRGFLQAIRTEPRVSNLALPTDQLLIEQHLFMKLSFRWDFNPLSPFENLVKNPVSFAPYSNFHQEKFLPLIPLGTVLLSLTFTELQKSSHGKLSSSYLKTNFKWDNCTLLLESFCILVLMKSQQFFISWEIIGEFIGRTWDRCGGPSNVQVLSCELIFLLLIEWIFVKIVIVQNWWLQKTWIRLLLLSFGTMNFCKICFSCEITIKFASKSSLV